MRGSRKEFADAIAFSTTKRSVDLTFKVASYGLGLDPGIQINVRRALAFRRAYTSSNDIKNMIDDIFKRYEEEGSPAIIKMDDDSYEDLRHKQVAGYPATKHRATIRRQCKPRGPVGHLLESVHMQAARMDDEGAIWQ